MDHWRQEDKILCQKTCTYSCFYKSAIINMVMVKNCGFIFHTFNVRRERERAFNSNICMSDYRLVLDW
jgi:hypothetical protein